MLQLGFLLWLIATIILRFSGQFMLDANNIVLSVSEFILLIPALMGLMTAIYHYKSINTVGRPKVAMLIALPGMILDVGSILFFPDVFPNIDPGANILFAWMMLWAYGIILISGILPALQE